MIPKVFIAHGAPFLGGEPLVNAMLVELVLALRHHSDLVARLELYIADGADVIK